MNLVESLKMHRARGQALLAANFYNAETLFAILRAAKACESEIILQTSPSTLQYLGPATAVALARAASEERRVKTWLHLDHATDPDLIQTCIDLGYDSVMIDASECPFEQNVAQTRRIVESAHRSGVVVEAELGYVPKLGQTEAEGSQLTSPEDACRFVAETGVDLLAVAIGTAHGFYKSKPKIDFERLHAIRALVDAPLVLHGGSDIAGADWQRAISLGIVKINFATEIKHAFMSSLQEELAQNDEIDLRKVFPVAINTASKLVESKIRICQMESLPATDESRRT